MGNDKASDTAARSDNEPNLASIEAFLCSLSAEFPMSTEQIAEASANILYALQARPNPYDAKGRVRADVREELDSLSNRVTDLSDLLRNLSLDTKSLLMDLAHTRRCPQLFVITDPHKHEDVVNLSYFRENELGLDEVKENSLNDIFSGLQEATNFAKSATEQVARGPFPNRKLDKLLQVVADIWQTIRGEEYTLDWFKGGPNSDAARFSVRITTFVYPDVEMSAIRTSARKAQESLR